MEAEGLSGSVMWRGGGFGMWFADADVVFRRNGRLRRQRSSRHSRHHRRADDWRTPTSDSAATYLESAGVHFGSFGVQHSAAFKHLSICNGMGRKGGV